ncbi:MAG: hypothetical protein M1826_006324 [Phylliscum demangeonii]|nr:MAG: hypothetical protein M1826_006324 [Phylliscum demangeonii]
MLAKRTTDEESANQQEDVQPETVKQEDANRGTNAGDGPVVYTPEEMTAFREVYYAARRNSDNLRNKLQRAKAAGAEVSPDDLHELTRLTAVTYQHKVVVSRARKGKPVDRKTSVIRQDVASLEQDPTIQEIAQLGVYNAQQLAEYRRSFLDSLRRFREKKTLLEEKAKVRKVTEAELADLADLQRTHNLQRKRWERVRAGKPADTPGSALRQSVDDLQQNAKLQEIAATSGYSVRELAEARRSYLDAHNAARYLKAKLSKFTKRPVTADEQAQLDALWETATRRKRLFDRMCRGLPADGDPSPARKDPTYLVQEEEIQRIAHAGGYRVEEVAAQKRAFLDATYRYRDAQKAISGVKKFRGLLTPAQEDDLVKTDHAYHLHKAAWERMTRREPVDPTLPAVGRLGRLAKDVARLVRTSDVAAADGGPAAHPPPVIRYTPQLMAKYDRQFAAALEQLQAFEEQVARAADGSPSPSPSASPRPLTADEDAQLKRLRGVYEQRKTEWARVHQGLVVDGVVVNSLGTAVATDDPRSVTYTAEEVEGYNRLYLDALRALRIFDRRIAAAFRADPHYRPTPDDDAQRRALREDFNQKKTTWTRARLGKPMDRVVHYRRSPARSTRPPAKKRRPPPQAPASQPSRQPGPADHADPAPPATKEDASPPPQQPLQISLPSGRHLFAPVLSSARHLLQRLVGRPWRAVPWPWARSLAHPRVPVDKLVTPAEWLRAEHAL